MPQAAQTIAITIAMVRMPLSGASKTYSGLSCQYKPEMLRNLYSFRIMAYQGLDSPNGVVC